MSSYTVLQRSALGEGVPEGDEVDEFGARAGGDAGGERDRP